MTLCFVLRSQHFATRTGLSLHSKPKRLESWLDSAQNKQLWRQDSGWEEEEDHVYAM